MNPILLILLAYSLLALAVYFVLTCLICLVGRAVVGLAGAPSKASTLPGRFPSLDGWRAVSIVLVLGEHSTYTFDFPEKARPWFKWLFDGDLGVRFFFVISGFLITYILLRESVETGALNLRQFYLRRALRILPVYLAFLAVVFLLQLLTPAGQPLLGWISNLTFTTNFFMKGWLTRHLWSLAIEEQFYLLWPLVLGLAGLQNRRRIVCLLVAPIILSPFCKAMSCTGLLPLNWAPFFQVFSSLYYFDSLAMGCLAAVLFSNYAGEIEQLLRRFGRAATAAGTTLILIPCVLGKLSLGGNVIFATGSTLQAAGFALLLWQSILFPAFFKPLNWTIVKQIGVLSYSLYIWHILFCSDPRIYGLRNVWFMSFYDWLAPAFLAATISFYCLERPLMNLRAKLRPKT